MSELDSSEQPKFGRKAQRSNGYPGGGQASAPEALAVALEEAAHRVIATVRWSRRQRFMPHAQLKQWKHVVRSPLGPSTVPRHSPPRSQGLSMISRAVEGLCCRELSCPPFESTGLSLPVFYRVDSSPFPTPLSSTCRPSLWLWGLGPAPPLLKFPNRLTDLRKGGREEGREGERPFQFFIFNPTRHNTQ